MVKLVTLAFNTNNMPAMVQFYRALGAQLVEKTVRNSQVSYQGVLGQLNISIYSIQKNQSKVSPNLSMKLEVVSLSEIMQKLNAIDDVQVIMDQESLPEGKLSIVLDPEGHSIELLEPWPESE